MCFGPVPSFASSALLTVVGAASLRHVRRKRELLLAVFPFLFAVQQFDEGLLWLALQNGASPAELHRLALVFLLFALCIWPACAPFGVYLIEADAKRQRLMMPIVAIGIGLGIYISFFLATGSCSAYIHGSSIKYQMKYPLSKGAFGLLYLVSVFGAWLVSKDLRIVGAGVFVLLLARLAQFFNARAYISVWCFFAAVSSSLVYFALRSGLRDSSSESNLPLFVQSLLKRLNDVWQPRPVVKEDG